jgi:hypothetical protein
MAWRYSAMMARTRKRAHQHHQARLGQVEVGDQPVHQLELKARRDEDAVSPASGRLRPRLQRAHGGRPHGHHLATTRRQSAMACWVAAGTSYHSLCMWCSDASFRSSPAGRCLRPHAASHWRAARRARRARPAVPGQSAARRSARPRRRGFWQTRSGSAARHLVRIGVLDVGRQRHVAVALHQRVGVVARVVAQHKAEQGAVGIGPAAQQRGT